MRHVCATRQALVAKDFPGVDLGIDWNDYTIHGGNLDFSCKYCGSVEPFGRWGGSLHDPGGWRAGTIHGDTMSAYTGGGSFGWGDFFQILEDPIPLVVHATVDVGIGTLFYGDDEAIPRP